MEMKVIRKNKKKVNKINFPYTMNIYKGCSYGCLYCYSCKPCKWNGYGKEKPIYEKIEVKKDIVKNLKEDLAKLTDSDIDKRIQIGNTWDVYPKIEEKNKITRECLEVFTKYPDWTIHLETKSELILNDIDVIKKLPNFQAEITITTLTKDGYFEPNAPSSQRRFEVIEKLSNNGIYVRVMIMPYLGEYTNFKAIREKAISLGAEESRSKDLKYFNLEELLPDLVTEI